MIIKSGVAIFIIFMACHMSSCSPKNNVPLYYSQNEKGLVRIKECYTNLYLQKPFTIAFTDKKFKTISLEIITDSINYIYAFGVNEPRLADTLVAYRLNANKIIELVNQMQSIRCNWINNFYYYIDEIKHSLIYFSIKPEEPVSMSSNKKYYNFTCFQEPQYFDSTGQLILKRKLNYPQKINGEIFKRINDSVCYSISNKYR